MSKDFYLKSMIFLILLLIIFCVTTVMDIDLFGGLRFSKSSDAEFNPTLNQTYKHKGTNTNPLPLYSTDETIYAEMLKSIHNGERDFYFDTTENSTASVKERLEQIKSYYLTACQSIYPTLISVCSYRYEYLSSSSMVIFTLSDIGESASSVKKGYEDYKDLRNYVKKDINKLYDSGVLKKNMSDKELSYKIAEYIAHNAQYDKKVAASSRGPFSYNSTAGSKVHNPLGFYKGWDIVCDGYAALYNVFMWELGIESYIVTSSNHAWNLAYLDGKWYHTDVTYADPVTYDKGGNIGATMVFQDEYVNLTYTQIKAIDNDHTLSKESKHFVNTVLGLKY